MNEHVSPSLLERYLATSEQLDDQVVSSVEDHVMGCAACRSLLARSTPTAEIERSWCAIVGELELSAQGDSARPLRRVRPVMLAAASIAVIALLVSLAVRREPPPIASPSAADFVDLGSVDEMEPGEVRWIEEHRLFLVRTDNEHLLLSQRSPTRGCRLVTGDELDASITLEGTGATFADPCHGATFALDGTRLGGPTPRGMYRYRFEVLDDRIVADLRLLLPGPLTDPEATDTAPPLPGPGVVDAVSQAWLDAARAAVEPVLDVNAGPTLWPLGAFHDSSTGVVTVYMTVAGDLVRLQVGTLETLEAFIERDDPQRFEVLRAHFVCDDQWAATPATVVSCAESVGYLNVVAPVDDQTGVVAELYAPDGGERVVVLTLSTTATDAPASAAGSIASNVLLHVVEAFEEQP